MTVHIHIYEGNDGPVQPRTPIQRPTQRPPQPTPAPAQAAKTPAPKPAPTPDAADDLRRAREAIERQGKTIDRKNNLLLALAKQLCGQGDLLGANLIEALEQASVDTSDHELMKLIDETQAMVSVLQKKQG